MKRLGSVSALLTVFATAACSQDPGPAVFDFDAAQLGPVSDCTPALTGGGRPVDWQALDDPTAPNGPRVIAELSADPTGNRFPLCAFPAPLITDVEVAVAFKPVSGRVDQAAGVMVRVQDQNNYYIARANALENNVRFYKVERGRRVELGGANAVISNGRWATLGIRIQGNQADILLDGIVLFGVTDDTFSGAGMVGVWTKADSVTYFDHFVATPLP